MDSFCLSVLLSQLSPSAELRMAPGGFPGFVYAAFRLLLSHFKGPTVLIVSIKSIDSGVTWLGLTSHLGHILAELPWDIHVTSLSLSSLSNQMVPYQSNSSCLIESMEDPGKGCRWGDVLLSST